MIYWFFIFYITVRIISVVCRFILICYNDYPRKTTVDSPGQDTFSMLITIGFIIFAFCCLKSL
jgi:hypothetical protein